MVRLGLLLLEVILFLVLVHQQTGWGSLGPAGASIVRSDLGFGQPTGTKKHQDLTSKTKTFSRANMMTLWDSAPDGVRQILIRDHGLPWRDTENWLSLVGSHMIPLIDSFIPRVHLKAREGALLDRMVRSTLGSLLIATSTKAFFERHMVIERALLRFILRNTGRQDKIEMLETHSDADVIDIVKHDRAVYQYGSCDRGPVRDQVDYRDIKEAQVLLERISEKYAHDEGFLTIESTLRAFVGVAVIVLNRRETTKALDSFEHDKKLLQDLRDICGPAAPALDRLRPTEFTMSKPRFIKLRDTCRDTLFRHMLLFEEIFQALLGCA